MQALVPITDEVNISYELHRFIIGQKGVAAKKLMDDFDVNISVPPSNDKNDTIKLTGPRANVDKAKEYLKDRVEELKKEREDFVRYMQYLSYT
jgi:aromatic ring-opening dioxygenase LigB subunit